MNYHLTMKSGNKKTGPIPVTTTGAQSCPPACAFIRNGCYGDGGPIRIHWDKVSSGDKRAISLSQLVQKISELPKGQLWRHDQVGDLPGIGNRINTAQLRALVVANEGRLGFTYTHKPVHPAERTATTPAVSAQLAERNRAAIRAANAGGFTVNLSANNLAHADELSALNIAPVAVALPSDASDREYRTPSGRRVVVCPATYIDRVNCKSCALCQKNDARPIIGFPASGQGKAKVSAIARGN